MQTLYKALLTLHIAAFITAVGTVVLTLASYHQFWKLYEINREQGRAAFNSMLKTRMVGMTGLFVAILAGLSMEIIAHGAHAHFLWFRIKMAMVILLFVNGFTLGRVTTIKLQKLVADDASHAVTDGLLKLKQNSNLFMYSQLLIYLTIIAMMAFRFN